MIYFFQYLPTFFFINGSPLRAKCSSLGEHVAPDAGGAGDFGI